MPLTTPKTQDGRSTRSRTVAHPPKHRWILRRFLWTLAWLALAALAFPFFRAKVLPYFIPGSISALQERLGTEYAFFLPHVLAGAIAIVLGPTQFSSTLRARHLSLHRCAGRVYLIAILVGGVTGMVVATTASGGLAGRSGLGMLAVAWLVSGAMAYTAIRRRNIEEHRAWMIRSYVLGFTFVTFRVIHPYVMAAGYDFQEAYATNAWASWVIPLLITDVLLSRPRQRIDRTRSRMQVPSVSRAAEA